MTLVDLAAFEAAPLTTSPFEYLIVRRFLLPGTDGALMRNFPDIDHAGLLPVEATRPGPLFHSLIEEMTGPAMTDAVSRKFGVDLTDHPTMVTVRGMCQERDGRIHTDSDTKVITALLYFNAEWEAEGGRLRLLRSATDLEDVIAEVPPLLGTLLIFRRSENSFHGHEPFIGIRRALMVNWMTNTFAAQRELMRHRLSAQAKKILHYA
jgi:hypothetical protein